MESNMTYSGFEPERTIGTIFPLKHEMFRPNNLSAPNLAGSLLLAGLSFLDFRSSAQYQH